MISQETIQQILSRIDIVEIVGGFVKLKKRGANYLGNCPFHNEKTPSFTVSPAKELYKCFGCGKSGNAVSFLMEHEKYSYVDALKFLANKYNVTVEETFSSPQAKEMRQTADSLHIINAFAQQFFSKQLFESEEGQAIALSYLKERGFREDIIHKFQIGYSPRQRDAFTSEALRQQYNPELLTKTGIVAERNGELMDNYRERIIFPVHNNTGKIIGFGARIIGKKENAPKYINTPENEVYVKSKILYGTYFARQSIDKNDECLLVEGYTDVVSLHQAGIENVVASGGTSLTQDQLRLIKKYTNNLTILYDGDAAGVKAAMRGLDLALEEGLNVRLVLIPDNEDPDSYVNKVGAAGFNEFIRNNKKDVILFQLEVMLKDAGNDSTKKAAAVNTIAESISRINKVEDFTRKQDYIKKSAELLKIDEAGLLTLVNKLTSERVIKQEERFQQAVTDVPPDMPPPEVGYTDTVEFFNLDIKNERALVCLLLEFGLQPWDEQTTVAQHVFAEVDEWGMVEDAELLHLSNIYRDAYLQGTEPTLKGFLFHEDQTISKLVVSLSDFGNELSPNWIRIYEKPFPTKEDLYVQELQSVLTYLKLRKIKKMVDENQRDMELPHSDEELITLLKTHQHLKELEMELTRALGTVIVR
ncbi:DNA primase [Lacibacter cauensis]|uniref:DNA primase n=1 Tax=Lacibacter cauensis TaxID=510947 RepID=A0A562SUC1_9BACT|nr:DNA primase [Lacibacter cauensis]TWI84937.1 DNA primase [Lacibacter cauensis]